MSRAERTGPTGILLAAGAARRFGGDKLLAPLQDGTPVGAAVPSEENALRYLLATLEWTDAAGIDLFYFAAFDEAWKVGAEGDVGAYWGLWDKDGRPKFA